MSDQNPSGWVPYALGSAFFASLTAIFGKLGVHNFNSNFATFLRTIVILIFTAVLISVRGEWQFGPQLAQTHWKNYLFLVLSALATGASWLFYYRALQLGQASQVAPVDKLSVVFAFILALVFLGEKASLTTIIGVILIASGSVIIATAK